jgi:PAS domain S-box-containing protein
MTPEPNSVLDSSVVLVVGTTPWTTALADRLRAETDATVESVETATRALDAVRTDRIDCVLTEHALADATGVELVESIRDHTSTLPVLLATADGSEAVASDAIAAGVTDYVPVAAALADAVDAIVDRTERALRAAVRTRTRRDRARQFDATFHDSRTATWVLEPDGTVARVNRTARTLVDADADAVVGEPFWALRWWAEEAVEDVRDVVGVALDGSVGHAVVTRRGVTDDRVVELSAQPVTDARDRLVSVVVEGVDITDRVALERELRESEELHRVTLNNMTDTVLITDEDGTYTYVCPNVHFIFGYTADEIHEQGRIEELLGEELFDREALAEEGVLKNIECTATDKAGREHTLLVNVREVSIQGGSLLYSCRDITKRKQREAALTALQATARSFLYAETAEEIAQHVVDDAADVLDMDASAVYLFDADDNDLRPAARSRGMRAIHGPLPTVHADGQSLPSYSFVEDETLFFDDVHAADRLDDPATDLRSAAYIPLGNHGLFVAGSTEVGAFDEVASELADLLAATAEAALDRVSREARLREQDRELQTRNEQLTTLNRVNETIREIDQAIVRAETPEEIDHTVCDLLTADDRFRFAWIGTVDAATGTVEPRAWAGTDHGYLNERTIRVDDERSDPAGMTAASGEATVVSNVAADLRAAPWRKEALARDLLSVLSVPLSYNDVTHGVLTVYAGTPDAFDDTVRAVLEELGRTIAAAISASERKRALLTSSQIRLEFAVRDPSFVLSRLAREAGRSLSYQGGVRQTADGEYVFVAVDDGPVEAVVTAADGVAGIDEARRMSGGEAGGVVRLRLTQPFLATGLADHGAVVRSVTASPDGTSLVVEVPDSTDPRRVTELIEERFAHVDLTAKRRHERPSEHGFYATVLDEVTDRQLEVVETAYYSGFFQSPRGCTGEDVADSLDISPQAFYQHVRTVQRKLFETLIEDYGAPVPAAPDD